MLALNLVQVCQNWLKPVMVEGQVLRYQTWSNDEQFFYRTSGRLESFAPFLNDVDESQVVIGVQVRDVDGFQVTEDVQRL